jgi:hypothetical protein
MARPASFASPPVPRTESPAAWSTGSTKVWQRRSRFGWTAPQYLHRSEQTPPVEVGADRWRESHQAIGHRTGLRRYRLRQARRRAAAKVSAGAHGYRLSKVQSVEPTDAPRNAVSAFANCGRAVAHVRGYGPKSGADTSSASANKSAATQCHWPLQS